MISVFGSLCIFGITGVVSIGYSPYDIYSREWGQFKVNHPEFGRTREVVTPVEPDGGERLLCSNTIGSCFVYDRSSHIGPSCWFAIDYDVNRCCSERGNFQSPIRISRVNRIKRIDKKLRYKSETFTGVLENNGLYPEFLPSEDSHEKLVLKGVPSSSGKKYVFENIHFHFGPRGASRQTEHVVEGKRYDAEAHLVHIREDFSSVSEASKVKEGIAVIGIFLSVTAGDESSAFNEILRRVPSVFKFTAEQANPCFSENLRILYERAFGYKRPGQCTITNTPQIKDSKFCQLHTFGKGCGQPSEEFQIEPNELLSDSRTYYNYPGGLTTPPCSESVIWLVARDPVKVRSSDIRNFARVQSRIVDQLVSDKGNLRPLQRLAGREVKLLVFKGRDDENGGNSESSSNSNSGGSSESGENGENGESGESGENGQMYGQPRYWNRYNRYYRNYRNYRNYRTSYYRRFYY